MHDDLEVAFHLGERHRIGYVRALPMGISARPFGSLSDFGLRIHRGFHGPSSSHRCDGRADCLAQFQSQP